MKTKMLFGFCLVMLASNGVFGEGPDVEGLSGLLEKKDEFLKEGEGYCTGCGSDAKICKLCTCFTPIMCMVSGEVVRGIVETDAVYEESDGSDERADVLSKNNAFANILRQGFADSENSLKKAIENIKSFTDSELYHALAICECRGRFSIGPHVSFADHCRKECMRRGLTICLCRDLGVDSYGCSSCLLIIKENRKPKRTAERRNGYAYLMEMSGVPSPQHKYTA